MSVLSKPYFHNEDAAFAYLESVIWADSKPYETVKTGQTKVLEVWNGKAATAVREQMTNKGRGSMPICAQCQRQGVCFKW